MSQIKDLIEEFSFKDEISKATAIKAELEHNLESVGLNAFDFAEDPIDTTEDQRIPRYTKSYEEELVEEPYDAEANASSLVYTMNAIDSLLLSFAVNLKCRADAGGGKTLKKMKAVLTKELTGAELTEHEKLLKAKFEQYKANMKLLTDGIFPSQPEIDRLIQAAIPYCEETKLKMGSGFAFWTNYVGSVVTRASKIMTA